MANKTEPYSREFVDALVFHLKRIKKGHIAHLLHDVRCEIQAYPTLSNADEPELHNSVIFYGSGETIKQLGEHQYDIQRACMELLSFHSDFDQDKMSFNFLYEETGTVTSKSDNLFDTDIFLQHLRYRLEQEDLREIAELLKDATCTLTLHQDAIPFEHEDGTEDYYSASGGYIALHTTTEKIPNLEAHQDDLWHVAQELLGTEVIGVSFTDQSPSASLKQSNQGTKTVDSPYRQQWNGFFFGSKSELSIAKELDKRGVLFFPGCLARLGKPKDRKSYEPDFLIFHKGKWGILEVSGAKYHTPENAPRDHTRVRSFSLEGIKVEHYDAHKCLSDPTSVIDEFLEILERI